MRICALRSQDASQEFTRKIDNKKRVTSEPSNAFCWKEQREWNSRSSRNETMTMIEVGTSKKEARLTQEGSEDTRKREKEEEQRERERERERGGGDGGHVLCIIHADAFHVYFRV